MPKRADQLSPNFGLSDALSRPAVATTKSARGGNRSAANHGSPTSGSEFETVVKAGRGHLNREEADAAVDALGNFGFGTITVGVGDDSFNVHPIDVAHGEPDGVLPCLRSLAEVRAYLRDRFSPLIPA